MGRWVGVGYLERDQIIVSPINSQCKSLRGALTRSGELTIVIEVDCLLEAERGTKRAREPASPELARSTTGYMEKGTTRKHPVDQSACPVS
jgi:hypothetical protein